MGDPRDLQEIGDDFYMLNGGPEDAAPEDADDEEEDWRRIHQNRPSSLLRCAEKGPAHGVETKIRNEGATMTPMRTKALSPEHKAFLDDMLAIVRKHQHMARDEMLSVAAHLVGQILALQDRRHITPETGLEIILLNIEAGSAQVIEKWLGRPVGDGS